MALTPEQKAALDALEAAAPSAAKLGKELDNLSNSVLETINNSSELASASTAAAEQLRKVLKREIEQRGRILNSIEKSVERTKKLYDQTAKMEDRYERAIDLNNEIIRRLDEQIRQNKDNIVLARQLQDEQEKLRDNNADLVREGEKYNKALDETNKQIDTIAGALSKIAKGDFFGGLSDAAGALTSKLGDIAKTKVKDKISSMVAQSKAAVPELQALGTAAGSGGGAAGSLSTMAAGAGSTAVALGPLIIVIGVLVAVLAGLAVMAGIAKMMIEFSVQVANAGRELAKTTGLSQEFSNTLMSSAQDVREFGATVEDLTAANQALNQTFTDFSMLSPQVAVGVSKTTTVLTKLGMSAGDVATGFQNLTKAMGQTPREASGSMLELEALSRDLGVSASQMGADFAGAAPQLAKLGKDGVTAFKQLAVVSKSTGIEVNRLLAIVEKFDTFEGAATQAGKLNAALGGNFVNAMELLTATNPVERFEMIRDSILDAGLSFDEMSYYQRKFYAESAGLKDVGELALMLSGDFDSLNENVGKNSADYEAAAKRAKSFQSIQEELKNTLYSLMPVFEPLVEVIQDMSTTLSDFALEYKDDIKFVFESIGNIVVDLIKMFMAVAPLIIGITKLFMYFVGAISFVVGGITSMTAAMGGLRKSITVDHNSPPLLPAIEQMVAGVGGVGDASNTAMGSVDKLKAKMTGFRKELFSGDNNLVAGVKMTAAGMEGIGDASAKTAATMRATAPTIANNNAVSNAISNVSNNSVVNNNGQGGGATGINIKFDNKKFADLFDVQVEKSIGRAARKAVI
jgi:hypothetical protein